ncbi:MAG TPA: STAS domain-containing protein [Candidatus Hydrogenedens sp.]|nr:STAS domain-containing protein [Candidatus Hydrogenedens sp.]HOK09529.1 STAS domain-containing protein [Candidatus Hydrogenedens sp.]HOL19176.1 STAS domain-containing protein [Candidatus Hydrogenedens sp.]HPP58392.1 STAS domain-containing protein [Candidatus Hydrogenedens sp.]
MSIEVKSVEQNGNYKIQVSGQVDLYTSPNLRKAIMEAVDKSNTSIIIQLSTVEYMDSSGVATLVEGLRSAMKQKKSFKLSTPSPAVRKVLNLARLESVFTIIESNEE